jgi:hypothetical protein
VPLGEGFYDRGEQMAAAGFASFRPLMTFRESFCSSPEDRIAHRMYMIELAKERLGNAPPYPHLRDEWASGYRSPFLTELRQARARAGNSFEAYDKSKPWLSELSPCRFVEMQLNYTDPAEYDRRKRSFLEEQRSLRCREIEMYATELSSRFGLEKSDRLNLCKAVVTDVFGQYGFQHDSVRSTKSCLVFSKPIVSIWSLCWVVDGTRLLRPTGTRAQDQIGFLDIFLELRDPEVKGLFDHARHRAHCLRIPCNYAAPIDGLEWGYSRYEALPELETLIRANSFVYGMLNEFLERELLRALEAQLACN